MCLGNTNRKRIGIRKESVFFFTFSPLIKVGLGVVWYNKIYLPASSKLQLFCQKVLGVCCSIQIQNGNFTCILMDISNPTQRWILSELEYWPITTSNGVFDLIKEISTWFVTLHWCALAFMPNFPAACSNQLQNANDVELIANKISFELLLGILSFFCLIA